MFTATYPPHRPPPSRQQGVAAVEFAIIMFILFLVGAGLVEFGRALWYYDALAKGTRDAARYLTTVPTASLGTANDKCLSGMSMTAVECAGDIVSRAATAAGISGFTAADNVVVSCEPTACGSAVVPTDVERVRVEASLPMTLGVLFPFITRSGRSELGDIALTPHTTMRYLW